MSPIPLPQKMAELSNKTTRKNFPIFHFCLKNFQVKRFKRFGVLVRYTGIGWGILRTHPFYLAFLFAPKIKCQGHLHTKIKEDK